MGSSANIIRNELVTVFSKSLVFGLIALLLCICSTACTSADKSSGGANDTTSGPQPNSYVKAKVAIPKGLKFTNEMLDFGKLGSDADAKSSFKTKDEIIGKKAGVDIPQDKIITSADIAPKDEDEEDDESGEETETKESKQEDSTEASKKDSVKDTKEASKEESK